MPSVGESFEKGSVFGVVESVKAASDLYMPITGEVTEINEELNDSPERVNSEPYTNGWMVRIMPAEQIDSSQLLDAKSYALEIG